MDNAPDVKCTWWIDHNRIWYKAALWTAPDGVNTFIQLLIGFLLGAIWPCVSDILYRALSWCKFWLFSPYLTQRRSLPTFRESDEETALLNANHTESSYSTVTHQREIRQRFRRKSVNPGDDSGSISSDSLPKHISGAASGLSKPNPTSKETARHPRKSKRGPGTIIISILIFVLAILGSLVGSFSMTIPVDQSARSSSKICGSWSLKADNTDPVSESRDNLIQAQKESRAGQYGRECYPEAPALSPDHCNFFDTQVIPSHIKSDQPCPFADTTLCNGPYTAVTFSTGHEGSDGLVDASVLGLNSKSPKRPKFRRTSTCVPLNMSQGFIEQIPPDSQHIDSQFEYYLGPVYDSASGYQAPYTFKLFGDPSRWVIPTYLVKIVTSTPYRDDDFWQPVEGLKRRKDSYLTAFFIAPCRIFYTQAFNDDIFGADQKCPTVPHRCCNPDPRAHVLACVDYNEVCSHGKPCNSMEDRHDEFGAEYEFVREATQMSTMFKALQFRRGTALLAQEVVADYDSGLLNGPDLSQWTLESWAMFNTSLARIQYDALDIAVGRGHERADSDYERDYTPEWNDQKMCGLYKFKLPKGYTNINIVATAGLLLLTAFIACLSHETQAEFSDYLKWKVEGDREKWARMSEHERLRFHGNWMLWDSFLWYVWAYVMRPTLLYVKKPFWPTVLKSKNKNKDVDEDEDEHEHEDVDKHKNQRKDKGKGTEPGDGHGGALANGSVVDGNINEPSNHRPDGLKDEDHDSSNRTADAVDALTPTPTAQPPTAESAFTVGSASSNASSRA